MMPGGREAMMLGSREAMMLGSWEAMMLESWQEYSQEFFPCVQRLAPSTFYFIHSAFNQSILCLQLLSFTLFPLSFSTQSTQ